MKLKIEDTFTSQLPADPNRNNTQRQVHEACFSYVKPKIPAAPKLIHVSMEMANALGISQEETKRKCFLEIFSGTKILEGSNPYAMCYGGHQFGHWAGQLGDGRAINLAEIIHNNKKWALQLKGAGETPYSRTADGLAVLRSSIREHLCSEAMYHLGVPTTRSLSLSLSGDNVLRDIMYDGNAAYEQGAIVCRAAPSFIRFGNFQIFASRKDIPNLKKLTDYTIDQFFPEIKSGTKESYIAFFREVMLRTLEMSIHWQRVGFVHGVMNTDNMSILGLTIDYGPYGWLEDFDLGWTPNTTDAQNKRYAFGKQPSIALWNLYQLANALYILVEESEPFEAVLKEFQSQYGVAHLSMMKNKLGLLEEHEGDHQFVEDLEKQLSLIETDMTIFFRLLSNVSKDDDVSSSLKKIEHAFYEINLLNADVRDQWMRWFEKYNNRLQQESTDDQTRKGLMDSTNPKYVLRNYMAQMAIEKAEKGDYHLIEELHQILKKPYSEQEEHQKWFAKRPDWARQKVGCSMLSCSS